MDEAEGTVTLWHCGTAACSLAREDISATAVVHPNRRLRPVMDLGCRASEAAAIFRIGCNPDGTFRFFIAEGSVLDRPRQFCGTFIVCKTDLPAKDGVCGSVKDGREPHFVVVCARVGNELETPAHMFV